MNCRTFRCGSPSRLQKGCNPRSWPRLGRPSGVLSVLGLRHQPNWGAVGLHVIFIRLGVPTSHEVMPLYVFRDRIGRTRAALPDAPLLAVHAIIASIQAIRARSRLPNTWVRLLATPAAAAFAPTSSRPRIFGKASIRYPRRNQRAPRTGATPPPPARGGKVHHVIRVLTSAGRAASLRLLAWRPPYPPRMDTRPAPGIWPFPLLLGDIGATYVSVMAMQALWRLTCTQPRWGRGRM